MRWIFAIVGVLMLLAALVAAVGGVMFGFVYSSATSADQPKD